MQLGRVFREFYARDGQKVILRTPRREDLDDLIELINSLVDEKAEIALTVKVTREEEADWLGRKLAILEKDEELILVAEVDGRVIANSSLKKNKGMSSHTGEIDIIIREGYRNVGIGTKMLKTLIIQAKKMGLKMLYLGVFSTNKLAYHVYEKVGFKETGRRPKFIYKNEKYIDDVIMTKVIS